MFRHIRHIILLWSISLPMIAQIIPSSIIQDGMVLQQKAKVRLWGYAPKEENVSIHNTWNKTTTTAQTDQHGFWETLIETPEGGFTPQQLTLSCKQDTLHIRNILIGEVWLASGQSNMEMPLSGWPQCPIENSEQLIAQARQWKGKLRLAQVENSAANTPQDTCSVKWEECTPASAGKFSAIGYIFGRELCKTLNCPIGIINSSCSSTRVEAWLPLNTVKHYPDMAPLLNNLEDYIPSARPSCSFNAMINPLVGYTLRGFIWYQGEANVAIHYQYAQRFGDLITSWRTLWKQNNLPFYFVEIAPYIYKGKAEEQAPLLRKAQLEVSKQHENTAMVSTIDLVKETEKSQIHPSKKQEVGIRLAAQALSRTYGIDTPLAHYPELEKAEIQKRKVVLTISNAPQGFAPASPITGFEVCGKDQQYHPATAETTNNQITLTCPQVRQPKSVRYSFHDFPNGNVKNKAGLPLIPFEHTL